MHITEQLPQSTTMKALVFDRIGPPLEVLELRSIPIPTLKNGEVLVKVRAASINPGDFLFIQSLYPEPKKPRLPQQIAGTGGGVGIVMDVGPNVSLQPGTLVAFSYYNAWAEYAALPAEWLMPLPAGYSLMKGAQFANLITAGDLLEASRVGSGQWLALTAGNSTVATLVLQLARRQNAKVICLVRRAQADLDLPSWGATAVVELDGLDANLSDTIMRLTGGHGLDAVIDCVGGPQLGELIRSTALGAQVIVYGGYSAERFDLHNFDLLMRVIDIRSYAYRYFFEPPPAEHLPRLHQIAAATAADDFKIRMGGLHALSDFRAAIDQTLNSPERGKRFFVMSD